MSQNYLPIGILTTCFQEKFGVPKQSLMVHEARGVLKLNQNPSYHAALNCLDKFSHVWLIFVFHKNKENTWHPVIDPPVLNPENKVGVFASRSPHRPNPLGLSAVKLESIDFESRGGVEIHLSGVDILNGTPVLDIKPYLPYADCIPDANSGWATDAIERYPVEFSEQSLLTIEKTSSKKHPRLKQLITQMLELDPRPTSQRRTLPIRATQTKKITFAFRVLDLDIHWKVKNDSLYVFEILPCTAP